MRSFLCCFVAVAALTVIYADGQLPTLEIQPKGPITTKPVGVSIALTCKPSIQDPKLITQLEWRDPKQRRIEYNQQSMFYVQKLPSETGIILIFTKLAEHHAGTYTCSAKYSNTETIQASIKVSTMVDITFVDAPELQPAVLGQDYLIRCHVIANPPPEIVWIRNNEPIISEGRYIVKGKGLLIKNVKESDDGTYTCRAVVVVTGSLKEKNINVQVQVPPVVEEMKEVSIIEGEQASIQCKASGKPPPEYKWIKEPDRKDLAVTDRFEVNKNKGLLIINKAEYNDNAIYKCIARNLAGTAETSVTINVLVKPKIFELLNITTEIIKDTKIVCKASGRPTPTIVFRKLSLKDAYTIGEQKGDNRIVIEQNPNESKGENIGTLKIFGVNRTDDGLYECISENKVGTAYKNGHITVYFPPTFEKTKDYPPVWTWNNRPGNLSCIAEAIPNATIKWKLSSLEIGDSNPNVKVIGRGPQSNLIVRPFNDERLFNTYECVAENTLGTVSKHIQLRKAEVPQHIRQVTRAAVTATTVKFNIVGPPNLSGLPLRAYVVQYQTEREHLWETAKNRTWSIDAPYVIEDLQPQETYNFRFAAKNDVGLSGFDALQQITMPKKSYPADPKILVSNLFENNTKDFIANSPYADHFELRWNVPNDNGDPIDSYIIRYCVSRRVNGEWRDSGSDCSTNITVSFEYTSYELNELQADTTYIIKLTAHNSIGESSPAEIRVKTARGVDSGTIPYDPPAISSTMIIGIVIGAVILLLIIVDVTCFCVNRAGIIAILCYRSKPIDDEDPKLGSDEKEPLSPENIDNTHLVNGEKRNISVEFDGTRVYSKPVTEIGRHSAV